MRDWCSGGCGVYPAWWPPAEVADRHAGAAATAAAAPSEACRPPDGARLCVCVFVGCIFTCAFNFARGVDCTIAQGVHSRTLMRTHARMTMRMWRHACATVICHSARLVRIRASATAVHACANSRAPARMARPGMPCAGSAAAVPAQAAQPRQPPAGARSSSSKPREPRLSYAVDRGRRLLGRLRVPV